MQKKYTTLIAVLLLTGTLSAQTLTPMVISSSGAFYTSSSAILSTTIGEMTMIETFSSSANFLTQGFQQPEDLGVGIPEVAAGSNQIIAFPNPAIDKVVLQTNFSESGTLKYSIVNMLGQVVKETVSTKTQPGISNETINVKTMADGVYFIKGDFTSHLKTQSFTLKLTINK